MKHLVAIPLLFLVACTTLYTGIVSITSVVDSGMKDWAALSVAGKTSPMLDANVEMAHEKYRASAAVAQKALIAYKNGGDQQQWLKALNAVRASAGDLIDLIVPLLTPSTGATLQTNLKKATTL